MLDFYVIAMELENIIKYLLSGTEDHIIFSLYIIWLKLFKFSIYCFVFWVVGKLRCYWSMQEKYLVYVNVLEIVAQIYVEKYTQCMS